MIAPTIKINIIGIVIEVYCNMYLTVVICLANNKPEVPRAEGAAVIICYNFLRHMSYNTYFNFYGFTMQLYTHNQNGCSDYNMACMFHMWVQVMMFGIYNYA